MSYLNKAWAAVYRQILNQQFSNQILRKMALGILKLPWGLNIKNSSFTYFILLWVETVESNHEILEIHEWDLAGASGNSPFPHQHKQKNRKIVSVWSASASAQLKTVIPALSACIYTAKRRWLSGHHPLAVRGPRVPTQFHFRLRGWGTIQLPGLNQWVGGTPSPRPAMNSRRSICITQSLSPVCTAPMLQNPTQMNRALERISPKPMVDGFVEILDEFRNGCDEKAIQYRHNSKTDRETVS